MTKTSGGNLHQNFAITRRGQLQFFNGERPGTAVAVFGMGGVGLSAVPGSTLAVFITAPTPVTTAQPNTAGLCHSDLSVINGSRPRVMPLVLGHEASGIVREIGRGVADLKEGDHVVFSYVPTCGRCLPCVTGRASLCEPGARECS